MNKQPQKGAMKGLQFPLAAVLVLSAGALAASGIASAQQSLFAQSQAAPAPALPAQQPPASTVWPPPADKDNASQDQAPQSVSANQPDPLKPSVSTKSEKHITPEEAKQLFGLVDELIKFSSEETGLAIKSDVKRQMTSREKVESYLKEKFEEDEGARRMQRGEIVLEKFGLLDRDFALKPFLLALLKEQIEAYYDSKTKTVYMLDWVSIDEQKPVLAHELTHALQDQRVRSREVGRPDAG